MKNIVLLLFIGSTTTIINGQLSFTQNTVTDFPDIFGPQDVFAIDVDGDSDIDIISASHYDDKIAWYENNGTGSFTQNVISTSADEAYSVFAIDIDGDSDIDILSASAGGGGSEGEIVWYENNGSENFTAHTIATNSGLKTVYAIDLDGDGDIDVLSACQGNDHIYWYENNGSETFTIRTISNSTPTNSNRAIVPFDADGDTDIDVVSVSQDDKKLYLFINDGSENFSRTEIATTTSLNGFSFVFAIDLDGDSDTDIISGCSNSNFLGWYENNGSGVFIEHSISTTASHSSGTDVPISAHALDLDGDSDVDIILSGLGGANGLSLKWYQNDGYQSFTENIITTTGDMGMGVWASDLDGDNNADVIQCDHGGHKIHWYKSIINYTPAASNLTFTTDEDTELSGTLSGSDQGGDAITYAVASNPSNGTVTINASDGTFTYSPITDYNGTDTFTYAVSDGVSTSDPATVTITINPVNDAPIVSNMALTIDEDGSYLGTLSGSDVDGDDLTFSIVSSTENGTLELTDIFYYTYTPNANYNGTDSFTYKANDGTVDSEPATFTIIINPVNDIPEASDVVVTIDEDTDYNGTLSGSDIDGDALTYQIQNSPSNGEVLITNAAAGEFAYAPNEDFFGSDNFVFVVIESADEGSISNEATVYITVNPINDEPYVMNSTASTAEDTQYEGTLFGTDVDSDDLTFVIQTEPLHGTLTLTDATMGNYTYLPNMNFHGEDLVVYYVTDGIDNSGDAEVVITVNPENDAPVFPEIPDLVVDEDNTLAIQLLATDVDGDYLTYSVEPVEHIDLYVYNNQNIDSLLMVPQPDWNGTVNINLTVDDGNGLTNQASFVLTVNPVDDDPFVNGYLEDIYFYEDFLEPWEVNLDEIFTDIDGELTYTAIPSDPTVVGVEVSENILHLFSLENANGETDLIVTASNPIRSSVSDTLLVTVFSENDPPVITPLDPISFDEDQSYELPSMASLIDNGTIVDIDTDIEELGFDVFSENEHIYIEWNGDVSSNPLVIPDENYNGSGTISICVYDADYSECMDVSITVNPVNDTPFFTSQMHASVGVNQEFHIEVDVEDVDEQELSLTLTAGETNPTWITLTDFTMHGTPNELGTFPVYLTLSDGEVDVLDTFHLHVENFMPIITSITDIPNDQGGRVYVSFNASFFDNGIDSDQLYSLFRYDVFNNDSSGWVLVEAGGAIGDPSYTYEATTLIDSISTTEFGLTEFKVVASMSGGIFHSESMMGYSVDNIAPTTPTGLLATQSGNHVALNWDEMDLEDLNYYSIHRSEIADFEIMPDNLIGYSVDPMFIDSTVEILTSYYYKLNATDYAGNVGLSTQPVEGYVYVNLAPEFVDIDSQHVNEDQSFEYVLFALDGNEEDNLIYSAESSVDDVVAGVSNDTLSILLTENWNGLAELFVYVTDGELSDTSSFILTVNAVNDAPELFSLVSPDDGTQISITNQDIDNDLSIVFNWEESNDVDNDVLEYHFKFYNGTYSETSTDIIIDTVIITNSLEIPYQNFVDLIGMTGDNILSGQWFVNTSDGIEIVMSDEVWNISIEASEVLSIDGNMLPEVFALHQNYPNPFNPTTQIKYDIAEDSFVSITIYDVMGRNIRTLMNVNQNAGYHSIRWDAKNDMGEGISAGMYIYTIQAGDFRATKKMVLLK